MYIKGSFGSFDGFTQAVATAFSHESQLAQPRSTQKRILQWLQCCLQETSICQAVCVRTDWTFWTRHAIQHYPCSHVVPCRNIEMHRAGEEWRLAFDWAQHIALLDDRGVPWQQLPNESTKGRQKDWNSVKRMQDGEEFARIHRNLMESHFRWLKNDKGEWMGQEIPSQRCTLTRCPPTFVIEVRVVWLSWVFKSQHLILNMYNVYNRYIYIFTHVYTLVYVIIKTIIILILPVVPHKAVAEVSKIGNL